MMSIIYAILSAASLSCALESFPSRASLFLALFGLLVAGKAVESFAGFISKVFHF